jgi:hypothetical protein
VCLGSGEDWRQIGKACAEIPIKKKEIGLVKQEIELALSSET